MPAYPDRVQLIEVGLRDGLQREATLIPTADKVALVNALADAGLTRIQVTAFVHPKRVPQMADAEALCQALPARPDVCYSGLALNRRGVERAAAAGLRQADLGLSASDAHSRRNANRSVDEALTEMTEMTALARSYGMRVRCAVQCAFGYQIPNDVDPGDVLAIIDRFLELEADEVALADSSGLADPRQVAELAARVLDRAGETPLILHLHDTRGLGMANVLAALQTGVRHFDAAFGGLGGCPFIDGAAGNIATEDTVYLLDRLGITSGVDLPQATAVARQVGALLQTELSGKITNLMGEPTHAADHF